MYQKVKKYFPLLMVVKKYYLTTFPILAYQKENGKYRNRLEFFKPSHRKMICDNFTLRHSLMEDDYKTVLHDMISLKIIK